MDGRLLQHTFLVPTDLCPCLRTRRGRRVATEEEINQVRQVSHVGAGSITVYISLCETRRWRTTPEQEVHQVGQVGDVWPTEIVIDIIPSAPKTPTKHGSDLWIKPKKPNGKLTDKSHSLYCSDSGQFWRQQSWVCRIIH